MKKKKNKKNKIERRKEKRIVCKQALEVADGYKNKKRERKKD
jgi:hypothetical protein